MRNPAAVYSASANSVSTRLIRSALRSRWRSDPVFDVRRNTPSRWVSPCMHASAVIQLAERLMSEAP